MAPKNTTGLQSAERKKRDRGDRLLGSDFANCAWRAVSSSGSRKPAFSYCTHRGQSRSIYSGGSGSLNRISASLSGAPAGVRGRALCCHAAGQRGVVGLIGRAPVKRGVRTTAVVELEV